MGAALAVAACLAAVASAATAWRFTTDDAYISLRYSRHLADGLGLVWNPGEAPLEGFSNFLSVLLGAAAIKFGGDAAIWLKLVGLINLSATCALTWILARRFVSPVMASLPAWWLATSNAAAWWSVSGLETSTSMALITACGWLFLGGLGELEDVPQAPPETSPKLPPLRPIRLAAAGVAALAAALNRPEGLLLGAAMASALWWNAWRGGWSPPQLLRLRRIGVILGATFVAPLALYHVLRALYFGAITPHAVACKALHGGPSLALLGAFFAGWAGAIALAAIYPKRGLSAVQIFCWSAVLLHALVLLGVDPILAYQYRYMLPALPLLLISTTIGLNRLVAAVAGRRAWIADTTVLLLVGITLLGWQQDRDLLSQNARAYEARATNREVLGTWLSEHLQPGQSYAIGDAGLVPYLTPSLRVIDLFCLNCREFTSAPVSKDPDRFVELLLAELEVDYIVIHSARPDAVVPLPEYGIYPRLVNHPLFQQAYGPVVSFAGGKGVTNYLVFRRR